MSTYSSQTLEDELLTNRDFLTVINNTHLEEGEGRSLRLEWSRDVHTGSDTTSDLAPGQSDEKKSRGIGNGDNTRHFDIEVWRKKEDESDLKVGFFTHTIFNPPGSNGQSESTELYMEYTSDDVRMYRIYWLFGGDEPQPQTEIIGQIPRDQW